MRLVIDLQGAQSHSRNRGIGRYSRALAMAMVRNAGAHEVVVALNGNFRDATEDLRDAFAAILPPERLRVWYGPGRQTSWERADAGRRMAAEHIRAAFLASLRPDLLLVTSMFEGYGDDAVTAWPADFMPPPTISICYDLIPLLRPETYLNTPLLQEWYYRRLLQLTQSDGVLCISQFSRDEIVAGLGIDPAKAVNILAGVEPLFRPVRCGDEPEPRLLERYGLAPGYVLCVGAVEERKNLAGLIRGYAMLPAALRRKHPLVATGWNDAHQLPPLRRLASEVGLADGELRLLTEFVPDRDLPGLYRASAVTVCASLHEGFGLSVAEAMACGAATLCSNASSLPEVMDLPEALFDPADPASLAERLRTTLESTSLREKLSRYGMSRAVRFTWANTARRAWAAAETFASLRPAAPAVVFDPRTGHKPRMSVMTSLRDDPAPLRQRLQGLAQWYAIEIISDDPPPPDPMLRANFPVYPATRLLEAPADRRLYLLGEDTGVAVQTLRMLDAYPGVVVMGAQPLTGLLVDATGTDADALQRLLLELYGWHAIIALRDEGEAALRSFPLDQALRRGAIHVVETPDLESPALHAAIEQAYSGSPGVTLESCLSRLSQPGLALPEVAQAVATTFRPAALRSLFLDVSTIAAHDAGTGIQRVVRETALQLGHMAHLDARLELVQQDADGLQLAHPFGYRLFGLTAADATPLAMEPAEGDVFLGLDLNMHDVGGLADTIHFVRSRGARAVVVIYDLLPVQMPECFPTPVQGMFLFWLRTISRLADGLACISKTVADDLMTWLEANPPPRQRPLGIGWFHLGADFRPAAALDEQGAPPPAARRSAGGPGVRPALLAVGTLEPRKGQADILSAMDILWAKGVDIGLTLVGRTGWMMQDLEHRILAHPENGRRLRWVQDANDHLVAGLYRESGALVMASQGEGFGLPLVEAAHAGLPVITRDLPIFREVCGENALYFTGGAAPLAATIERWLALRAEGRVPDPARITTVPWRESSRRLARMVLDEDWYARWTPNTGDQG